MDVQLSQFNRIFFIGIAGTGMSAIAQYLAGTGKSVAGSDRYFVVGEYNETRQKLEAEGIDCYEQNGEGIDADTDLVVVSTAVENTVPEVQKALSLNIPILKRSEVLALITASKKTIAVGGTSGKSTTSAMLFHILDFAGLNPSIISGAGLTNIIQQGKIGNAWVGKGDWLVIEADESDGSIVQYHPEIGVLLNVDKDHQEMDELVSLFQQFRSNTQNRFIVNQGHALTRSLSVNAEWDFSGDPHQPAGFTASHFEQEGLEIRFNIDEHPFRLFTVGKHNMENAVAAVAVARYLGVAWEDCADALETYEGIYRRHQVIGQHKQIILIDDYGHNPVKCAASIAACQPLAPKVVAWFQPHGYGPTRFLKNDFIHEIAQVLRPQDEIWMSEIFYAGGTAVKDISANDLIEGIAATGKQAFFVAERNAFIQTCAAHLQEPCVLLLMGARDPGLEQFAQSVWNEIQQI